MAKFLSPFFPVPFFSGKLPQLCRKTPAHIVALHRGNHAHALLFRDAARRYIRNRFGRAQHAESQIVKPIVSDPLAGLAHQSLSLPWNAKPETTILFSRAH